MGRAVIFSNGEYASRAGVLARLKPDDYIVCADGALAWTQELGLHPDLVVGDMDSVSPLLVDQAERSGVEILRVPVEKNFTDTEMALREAIQRGHNQILVMGAWGGRIDHSLANLLLFPPFVEAGATVALSDGRSDAHYIQTTLTVTGCAGKTVSLLPLTPEVQGVTITAFYYPLQDAILRWGETVGISNIATEDKVSIAITKGMLLAVFTDLALATDHHQ